MSFFILFLQKTKMEKIGWDQVIGKLATELKELQEGQKGWFDGGSIWAILRDTHQHDARIKGLFFFQYLGVFSLTHSTKKELGAMMRSVEHLMILDEFDNALAPYFRSVPLQISENDLRQRILASDSILLTHDTLQDAIDCALSRLKRRVMAGTALFTSLEKIVLSSQSSVSPSSVPQPQTQRSGPIIPPSIVKQPLRQERETANAESENDETVPTDGCVIC